MAKEKPLDAEVVRNWLAALGERELFSDAGVRHLQSLIPDNNCMVVVTLSVTGKSRSLVFRRRRRIVPTLKGIDFQMPKLILSPLPEAKVDELENLFVAVSAPASPTNGQLWLDTSAKSKKVFQWDGTHWTLYGHLRDAIIISKQGLQECSFMEALANAHELARWSKCDVIYTFDGSTWGTA
jgi:hypothetical protein